MYTQHFNLAEPPFSIAPNPRYLYLSPQHREALAHLLYGIGNGGGFVALTGEVGTGKTTLCRCLLEQLPEDVDIALVFNPRLNSRELLASICDELHIAYPAGKASLKQLIDVLNRHLLDAHARGRRTIVLIDEAQNLSFEVLEQIRLLTNLETNRAKLLQIILVGQPELNHLLERPDLRQLSQRITARYHLDPLSGPETDDYIRHRLAVSGARSPIFSRAAVAEIYRRSGGIPRLVNVVCDRALLGAYSLGKTEVDRAIVRKAARELLPESQSRRFPLAAAGILTLLLAAAALRFGVPPLPLAAWLEQAGIAGAPEQPVRGNPPPKETADSAQAEPPQTTEAAPKPAEAAAGQAPGNESTAPHQAVGTETNPIPPAAPTLAQRLADPKLTREAAFARLLSLWKLEPPPPAEDPCVHAGRGNLRCLRLHGNWFRLRSFNHPAVLELAMPGGGRRYATLAGVGDGKANLDLGDGPRMVDLAELLPFWKGDAVLLWKPPAGETGTLAPGQQTETVRWIRERLRVPAPPGEEHRFDPALKARIVAFQTERGLAPDGRVGPHTLIYLGLLANDPAEPRLEAVSH